MTNSPIIQHVYTGTFIFEGSNCNPNGDPDNEGAPRVDDFTGLGLKSPQSSSRRIYDRAQMIMESASGYQLQIQRGTTIEAGILAAAEDAGIAPSKKLVTKDRSVVSRAACARFFDTRMGGGVLSVGSCPANPVNGVVTMDWGRSIYPVNIRRDTLTRCCETNSAQEKNQEMGRRYVISHGVYRQNFFVDPRHAAANSATVRDLAIYLDCLVNMFEFKQSVMGGMISMRAVYLFRHKHKYGDAPRHELIERVKVTSDKCDKALSWDDYNMHFDDANLPSGMKVFCLEDLLGGVDAIEANLLA